MNADPFAALMSKVDDAMELEEGRREAAISALSNTLKSDFQKKYPDASRRTA